MMIELMFVLLGVVGVFAAFAIGICLIFMAVKWIERNDGEES